MTIAPFISYYLNEEADCKKFLSILSNTKAKTATLNYDERGNLKRIMENGTIVQEFTFDASKMMVGAFAEGKGTAEYGYNGFRKRTTKLETLLSVDAAAPDPCREIRYISDITLPYNNLLMTEGLQNQSFIWGNELLEAEGVDHFYYLQDHLDSPIRLIDGKNAPNSGDTPLAYSEFGAPRKKGDFMNKKLTIILLLFMGLLLLSSCDEISGGITMSEGKKADARIEQIISTIKEKDSDALKTLFSKKALDEASDLDSEVDYLFEFMQGEILSWERDDTLASDGAIEYGKQTIMIRFGFNVVTDVDKYDFFIIDYNKDTINPDNEGVYMIQLRKSSYEGSWGGSWQERMRAGIWVQE